MTEFATANADRRQKIINFCILCGIQYEATYRPTYCKRYLITFDVTGHETDYNEYINKYHLY